MIELSKKAPSTETITAYDRAHISTYLRLFDADRDGAPWQDAADLIFGNAAETDPARLKVQHTSHLARAKWLVDAGYLRLTEYHAVRS
jgi:hypothetical protein